MNAKGMFEKLGYKELRKKLDIDEYLELIKEDKNLSIGYTSLSQYMYLLEYQLEEKDKVINSNDIKIKHIHNMLEHYKENHIICFDKDLWSLYKRINKELLEILVRGKNENEENI